MEHMPDIITNNQVVCLNDRHLFFYNQWYQILQFSEDPDEQHYRDLLYIAIQKYKNTIKCY